MIKPNISFELSLGRFQLKTIDNEKQLEEAFKLRKQAFLIEMGSEQNPDKEDKDKYDQYCDHLAIIDNKREQIIATSRLNCSLFSKSFYSESEFNCDNFLSLPGVKLEIGRVCVDQSSRNSIVIMLLWKAIGQYLLQSKASIVFGCGSIPTLDPKDAALIYKYLCEENKQADEDMHVEPLEKYKSNEFDKELALLSGVLTTADHEKAKGLLPSLCKSYFDIGCKIAGTPAFDRQLNCIDFLTVLKTEELDNSVKKKIMG